MVHYYYQGGHIIFILLALNKMFINNIMSVSNLLRKNNIELFLTTSKDGIKIRNINNNSNVQLQSNNSEKYKLVLPNKPLGSNSVLAVDTIVGDVINLKWIECTYVPPDFSTINCEILNANEEVNTTEISLISDGVSNEIFTRILQPDSISGVYNVILNFPNELLDIIEKDGHAIKNVSFLAPPNTINIDLVYTKDLPEFETEISESRLLVIKNNNNDFTRIKAGNQLPNTIDLILPENAPSNSQALQAQTPTQLVWTTIQNISNIASVFIQQVPNFSLTQLLPIKEIDINYTPSSTLSNMCYMITLFYVTTAGPRMRINLQAVGTIFRSIFDNVPFESTLGGETYLTLNNIITNLSNPQNLKFTIESLGIPSSGSQTFTNVSVVIKQIGLL